MNVTVTLPPETLDALAVRVAEILAVRTAADQVVRPNEYLSVKDAAFYLGCTEGRVRKLVERRQIPFVQDGLGCRISFAVRDLDQWMEQRRVS